jgi:hypothetical protein
MDASTHRPEDATLVQLAATVVPRHPRVADSHNVRRRASSSRNKAQCREINCAPGGGRPEKPKDSFRQAKRSVSQPGRKSLRSFGMLNRSFRGIVCFQCLESPFVSRKSRKRRIARTERRTRPAFSCVLKNSNKGRPVRQEKIGRLAGPGRRLSSAPPRRSTSENRAGLMSLIRPRARRRHLLAGLGAGRLPG